MFIELKGRTKDEAFKIGQDIADAVTADNPKPVKLKFEKVHFIICHQSFIHCLGHINIDIFTVYFIAHYDFVGLFAMCLTNKETLCRVHV